MTQDSLKYHRGNKRKTDTLTTVEIEIIEPKMYHVVLLNDDYTPMDFVIEILMAVFNKDYQQAQSIMLNVHYQQRGIAGTYTHEIATEKMNKTNKIAAMNEYPLQTVIEEE